jgi:outer membrane biosynthesis protein TonB
MRKTALVSALKAVKKWVCKPCLLNGVPTELLVTINVNFSLNKSGNKKN